MGFTKLDSGIVDSSIWSQPYATRIVWVTMLARSDPFGFVGASVIGLARSANVTVPECEAALIHLQAKDPDSRSPEFDGRRIETCERGWRILNYVTFRNKTYSNNPSAVRMRKLRSRHIPSQVTPARHLSEYEYVSESSTGNRGVEEGVKQECLQPANGQLHMPFEEFREKLGAAFGRKPSIQWGYLDQQMAAACCRRPDVRAELAEIVNWKRTAGKWGVRTVTKCLEEWDACLDKARAPKSDPDQDPTHQETRSGPSREPPPNTPEHAAWEKRIMREVLR